MSSTPSTPLPASPDLLPVPPVVDLSAAGLRPSPRQIDDIVTLFEQVRDEVELADERYEQAKDELIALVQRFGTTPAGAEMSLRLEGALTVITVTTGTTIAVKEDAVHELRGALEANDRLPLFSLLFAPRTKHDLQKDADKHLRGANLPQRLAAKITSLYARCFDVKKKSPSLKVDRIGLAPAKKTTKARATSSSAKKAGL